MPYSYTERDGQRVEVNVAAAFDKLAKAFNDAHPGITLHVTSGTRTRAEQTVLYDEWIEKKPGANLAAPPGQSNHEDDGPIGPIALDLHDSAPDAGVSSFGNARNDWLAANAPKLGFVQAGATFVPKEAWHYEYQGKVGITPPATATTISNPSEEDDMPLGKILNAHVSDTGTDPSADTIWYVSPTGIPVGIKSEDDLNILQRLIADKSGERFNKAQWDRLKAYLRGEQPIG
jgi:hypothetical protein